MSILQRYCMATVSCFSESSFNKLFDKHQLILAGMMWYTTYGYELTSQTISGLPALLAWDGHHLMDPHWWKLNHQLWLWDLENSTLYPGIITVEWLDHMLHRWTQQINQLCETCHETNPTTHQPAKQCKQRQPLSTKINHGKPSFTMKKAILATW